MELVKEAKILKTKIISLGKKKLKSFVNFLINIFYFTHLFLIAIFIATRLNKPGKAIFKQQLAFLEKVKKKI